MIARPVFYEGRVQGVGFRFTVKQTARGYDVTGWVRNLEDGRVELQVNGETEEVEGFLTAVTESELKGHIKRVEMHPIPLLEGTRGFDIVR
ncbi:MAG: acylphosphatase [Verrucomicrobiaceae bacterium]|nr:MAG: acylphosphatase [Verrucomicrobiaceae bacterium]